MNQCWFPLGGEASGEAALSGEARAEISRELDELFSREFDVGNPEVFQNKRDGKDLESAGAPGQDVLHEHDFHVDVLPGSEPQRTRNKRATILAHPQIHLSLLA